MGFSSSDAPLALITGAGKGIGKAVCTEGLIYLKEKGIKQSILYVDDDNIAGKGLYQSLGFN